MESRNFERKAQLVCCGFTLLQASGKKDTVLIGYILGLYWNNAKENGNYHDIMGYIGIIGVYMLQHFGVAAWFETVASP